MQKENRSHTRRIKKLGVMSALLAIILAVSTYAWFVGMASVNVTDFDVEIASTKSLKLSLNGSDFTDTVSISKEDLETVSYSGHTNSWEKLVPVSTIGEMDSASSRLKLFEKASFTATPGGFRLMASRVANTGAKEKGGYVVFDLFVQNFSGSHYITGLNQADEEAIYLTVDSSVTVAAAGVRNTGIENSVRVAFAQIGRVIAIDEDSAAAQRLTNITGITCANSKAGDSALGVTGICREAQIWEPNDTYHVDAALSWYNNACKERKNTTTKEMVDDGEGGQVEVDVPDGLDVTSADSYKITGCKTLEDGKAYETYAVRDDIKSEDNVDIYDGADYNSYTHTSLLESYDYFTDTMKLKTGVDRPTFMTLAPNSITKVRIYIYIEGQDIDNYDFAQIGKKVSIKFGFTKERFTEEDIEYDGPVLNALAPVIRLTDSTESSGSTTVNLEVGDEYTEPGYEAYDRIINVDFDEEEEEDEETNPKYVDGDELTDDVYVDSNVNTNQPGTYTVTYAVRDADGNQIIRSRKVIVTANTP